MPNNGLATSGRQIAALPLLLGLLLIVGPVLAQQEPTDPTPTAPPGVSADTDEASQAADKEAAAADMEAPAADARPSLDYEPTESISEDLSVSFPVDI